jgi:Uma2 family endonuclease
VREGKPITLPSNSEPEPDIAVVQDLGDRYLEHHPYPENFFIFPLMLLPIEGSQ